MAFCSLADWTAGAHVDVGDGFGVEFRHYGGRQAEHRYGGVGVLGEVYRPEAAVGGPIGLLRDGDIIEIDIPNNSLNVSLIDKELDERKKAWTPPQPRITKGCLAKYASMATSADTGAILKW